jgi:hypothetical protein
MILLVTSAHPTRPPDEQCKGKRTYPFKRDAKKAMMRHGMQGRWNVYRCPHCDWWHLGSKLGRWDRP